MCYHASCRPPARPSHPAGRAAPPLPPLHPHSRPHPHPHHRPHTTAPALPYRYGLGQICYRQEKYGEALQHFRLAAAVNPRSSVLRCYCGMSAAKMGQSGAALEKLQVWGCGGEGWGARGCK